MPKSARTVSGRGPVSAYGNSQPLPPSAMASAQDRSQDAYSDVDGEGLLVSVRLLPQGRPEGGPTSKPSSPVERKAPAGTVKANEPFSIEIFVHNQTDEVRRLRIGSPGLESRRTAHQTGGIWAGKAGSGNSRTSDAGELYPRRCADGHSTEGAIPEPPGLCTCAYRTRKRHTLRAAAPSHVAKRMHAIYCIAGWRASH